MCVEVSGDLSPAVSDRLRFQGAKLSGASPGMILSFLFFFVPDSSHFLSPGTARRCNQPAPHVASLDDTPPHCSSASQARPLQSDMVPEICAGSPNLHPLCSNDGRQRDVSGCPRRCSSGVFTSSSYSGETRCQAHAPTSSYRFCENLPRCFEKRPCCTWLHLDGLVTFVHRRTHQLTPPNVESRAAVVRTACRHPPGTILLFGR